jgi:hypothetical protein
MKRISEYICTFSILIWEIEILWCNKCECDIWEIAEKNGERMYSTTISEVSYKCYMKFFSWKDSWKLLRNCVEIEEWLCRVFTWSISRIDYWYTRVFTCELCISHIFGSDRYNVCISWNDSNSISEYFSLWLTRECDICLRDHFASESMHRRFEWESCPRRWLVKECCHDLLIEHTTPSLGQDIIHFPCFRHDEVYISARKLFTRQNMTHREKS